MSVLKIDWKLLYLVEEYPDAESSDLTRWWFCWNDYQLYDTDTLIQTMGYENVSEIEQSGVYIEFPRTDMVPIEKEFIKKQGPRVEKQIDFMLTHWKKQAYCYTKALLMYTEVNDPLDEWGKYKDKYCRQVLENWCRENGIPYQFVD